MAIFLFFLMCTQASLQLLFSKSIPSSFSSSTGKRHANASAPPMEENYLARHQLKITDNRRPNQLI